MVLAIAIIATVGLIHNIFQTFWGDDERTGNLIVSACAVLAWWSISTPVGIVVCVIAGLFAIIDFVKLVNS